MRLLAGRARAHVDLKETGYATAVTRLGLEVLGPAGMLVTTGDRGAPAAVKREFPAVQTGLTIGGGGLGRALRLPARGPALSRVELARAAMPDWAVITGGWHAPRYWRDTSARESGQWSGPSMPTRISPDGWRPPESMSS